ncbi:hypothetical protein TRFO_38671 [Tritrichomonas foetus]|uniref:Uncharacterized protein n=1 Tax=Tritrichomonas foetus TaxID=1144522 RepID=A0A1J4J7B8_9EUKA|nr:hypothetical protein [Tritrichomonas foetus]OHS95118.1 hypothetical protein TRFO_38671 [Tritrichomonas foetus]|eukprot:OHS95118.1 hypothetical protein TRFO_38671 [Tritrichomonas foetus]
MDSESSSLLDASREWREKGEAALKASLAELSRGADRDELAKTKRSATRTAELKSVKINENIANLARTVENNQQNRAEWAKTQINEINDLTKNEIQSLDALRQQQQEIYQAQLAEKHAIWEKAVLERREEVAQLKSMVSHLTSAIAVAKNEAQADIDEAKRRAAESAKVIRKERKKQIKQIADLTGQISKEQSQFELEVKQVNQANANATQQKKDQLTRLQTTLQSLKLKLKEKENANEIKFREQVRIIRDLRTQLQQARDVEKEKQAELMNLRKMCTSISRKISARKDEAASIKRQLAMVTKDNEELQNDIVKLENQMFPQVFKPAKM